MQYTDIDTCCVFAVQYVMTLVERNQATVDRVLTLAESNMGMTRMLANVATEGRYASPPPMIMPATAAVAAPAPVTPTRHMEIDFLAELFDADDFAALDNINIDDIPVDASWMS